MAAIAALCLSICCGGSSSGETAPISSSADYSHNQAESSTDYLYDLAESSADYLYDLAEGSADYPYSQTESSADYATESVTDNISASATESISGSVSESANDSAIRNTFGSITQILSDILSYNGTTAPSLSNTPTIFEIASSSHF